METPPQKLEYVRAVATSKPANRHPWIISALLLVLVLLAMGMILFSVLFSDYLSNELVFLMISSGVAICFTVFVDLSRDNPRWIRSALVMALVSGSVGAAAVKSYLEANEIERRIVAGRTGVVMVSITSDQGHALASSQIARDINIAAAALAPILCVYSTVRVFTKMRLTHSQ